MAGESFGDHPLLVPATWKIPGLDICHHIDALMHLCFLGITKANSTDLIDSWLKGCRKANAFKAMSTPILKAIPPGVPFSCFNLKQKKAWLRAREINGINGKSRNSEVEEAFVRFTMLPILEIPSIVEPVLSQATLEEVNQVVVSWHSCASRIMSITTNPCEETVQDLDRHIKVFLTNVDIFDKSRRAKATTWNQKLPVWRRKSNYMGLLN
jgi:hypothetical protein